MHDWWPGLWCGTVAPTARKSRQTSNPAVVKSGSLVPRQRARSPGTTIHVEPHPAQFIAVLSFGGRCFEGPASLQGVQAPAAGLIRPSNRIGSPPLPG